MPFTQNFNYCMEQKRYTAYKFAKIIGASNQGVLNWQSGECVPYPKTKKKIADYFGITLAELDGDDRAMFLEELGIQESGLDRLIKGAFDLLGLQTFLTAGPDECRAWTIVKGTTAPKAAGKIHTDFERGFIRAEVVNYKDLLECGSLSAAKEKGLVGLEGKDYVVKDGDVILFRFNV